MYGPSHTPRPKKPKPVVVMECVDCGRPLLEKNPYRFHNNAEWPMCRQCFEDEIRRSTRGEYSDAKAEY